MTKKGIFTVLAFSFSLLLAGAAFAGGMTKAEGYGQKEGQAFTSLEAISTDQLKGMDVRNRDGKNIGEISAYQLDEAGNIRFLVVTTGGIFGVGAKEHFVPYTAFIAAETADALILTVDESLLASSPAKSPGMSEDAFSLELYEHYGQAPYWGAEQKAAPEAISE